LLLGSKFEECQSDNLEKRTLWIFSHPSFYPELVKIILDTFGLVEDLQVTETEDTLDEQPANKKPKLEYNDNVLAAKMEPKCLDKIPVFTGPSGVSATLLKDTLNRFRLVGPSTVSVLKNVLVTSTIEGIILV